LFRPLLGGHTMLRSTSDTRETTSEPAGCYCSFSAARGSWNAKGAKESSSAGMCPGTESTQCARETAGRRFPPDRPKCYRCRSSPPGPVRWGSARQHRKSPLLKYVVLSPTAPKHPSVLLQGRTKTEWKWDETRDCLMLTVVKAENGIEAKHSVLIFTHKMFSQSHVVKQKRPLNAGLRVATISLQF